VGTYSILTRTSSTLLHVFSLQRILQKSQR